MTYNPLNGDDIRNFLGGVNKSVYGVNPFEVMSPLQLEDCLPCEGRGWLYYPDGPEDYDKNDCTVCNGTGKQLR